MTNWKQLLEKRRDNFGQEKAEAYTEKALANIVAAYSEAGHASLEPLLLKALSTLEGIAIDFGTDYCDGNCLEAHETLAEIKSELESVTELKNSLRIEINGHAASQERIKLLEEVNQSLISALEKIAPSEALLNRGYGSIKKPISQHQGIAMEALAEIKAELERE